MKALCVHGVGQHDPNSQDWQQHWRGAVRAALGPATNVAFCTHDDLFVNAGLSWADTWQAIVTLGGSWWSRPSRGLFDGDNAVGWTAGMVTQWAGKPELRAQARDRLEELIVRENPEILFCHSLGSLIAYDLLSQKPALAKNRVFVTLGSQINSAFVQGIFANGVHPLPAATQWIHLFNPNDQMFTAEIRLDREGASNFLQFKVPFNDGVLGSHTNIHRYLNDSRANDAWPVANAWLDSRRGGAVRALGAPQPALQFAPQDKPPLADRRPRRALLIGINKYRSPTVPTLYGCVNDTFLVSAALQENGFQPDEIRMVLDDRATCDGIRERLEWLFEDVRAGDMRFLYFSGHGVRLPAYNASGEPDRMLEALVPADFDGTREKAVTDRDLAARYHGLPLDSQLIMAFDCCHSGGLSRSTGGPTASMRTFDLPDDIRHRMIEWNEAEQMWQPREFKKLIPGEAKGWRPQYVGKRGDTERIGRSVARRPSDKEFDKLKRETDWVGPYLPMILEACGEDELAEEYAFGDISYGIFTYALCHVLRNMRGKLTFQQLASETHDKVRRLGYAQQPRITGPTMYLAAKIPIAKRKPVKQAAAKKAAKSKTGRKKVKKARKKAAAK